MHYQLFTSIRHNRNPCFDMRKATLHARQPRILRKPRRVASFPQAPTARGRRKARPDPPQSPLAGPRADFRALLVIFRGKRPLQGLPKPSIARMRAGSAAEAVFKLPTFPFP